MLQREKAVIGQDRRIRMAEHAEKSALVLRKCLLLGKLGAFRCELMRLVWRDHTKTSINSVAIQRRNISQFLNCHVQGGEISGTACGRKSSKVTLPASSLIMAGFSDRSQTWNSF